MSEQLAVPPPIALAIGVCDLLYRDRGTGKRFILGCFSVVYAREFPAVHPALCIYLDLTNGRGQVPLQVQIVDADENGPPIWRTESVIEFSDPRMVAELDLISGPIEFPGPGEYRVQVHAGGHFITERRLIVNQLEG